MSDQASDYLTELTKNGPVELKIYGHQVGGHSLLMKIGNAICKPLLPREHWFYTYVPQELKAFTPVYHGEPLVSSPAHKCMCMCTNSIYNAYIIMNMLR